MVCVTHPPAPAGDREEGIVRRTRTARWAAAAIALALGLSACGSDDGGGGGSGEANPTLTLGVIFPPTSMAPSDSSWANESPYMQAVYDTLLKATPEGDIEPNLATEWTWNDDKTVLTLTLRDDVTFSDDSPLTADDVVASLLAFRDGNSPNKSNLVNVADVTAPDDTTVEITLSQPDPALEVFLTQNSGLVESSEQLTAPDVDTVPVGSGPYVLNTGDTVVGSSYAFDAREDYWNPDDQHYGKLVINVYADTTAQLNAIQGGQVNVSSVTDNTQIPQIEGAGFTAMAQELDWEGLILADREGTLAPALAEVKVRQAINYALDREALLNALIGGYGTATTQVFPTFSSSYDEKLDSFYEYDLDKAKQLMSEAGYADGFDVTMPRASAIPASTFTLVADQLSQIGINVTYEDLVGGDFITGLLAPRYPLTWFRLQQDPTDFQLAQFQIAETATWNLFHVADPTVADYIEQLRTGDEATAEQAGKDLNAYVVENAFFAPFYRIQNTKAVDANTTVTMQVGNTWPYLSSIQPK
jgi:peptide/nickel transport system substrate-binding protein